MKNFIFIVLLMSATTCFGQQDSATTQPDTAISYSGIVNVTGATKEELYLRARDWLSNNLQSLQIQDKQTGELSAKGIGQGPITFRFLGTNVANAIFSFNANIWVKDGKYMYTFANIINTSITYYTTTTKNDGELPAGKLYKSKHSKTKILGLSQTRSDETYQSAKDEFDKIEKGLVASLMAEMERSSTPEF